MCSVANALDTEQAACQRADPTGILECCAAVAAETAAVESTGQAKVLHFLALFSVFSYKLCLTFFFRY